MHYLKLRSMETYMMDGGGRSGSGGADVKMAGAPGATPPGATPTGATPTGATPPGATPPGATRPPRTLRPRPPRPRRRFGSPAPATAGAGGDDVAVLPPRPRRLFGPPAPATAGAGGDDVVAVAVVVVVPGRRLLFFLHSTPWYHSGGHLFLGGSLQEKIAK